MKYSVHSEVFALNPSLLCGVLIGKELNNFSSAPEDTARLRASENLIRQILSTETLRDHPNIRRYRETLEKAGVNPNKYPVSIEAMFKRVLKGATLPDINALVDLCNAVSLENQISLGGHDLKDLLEDFEVRFAKGTERFLPFGSTEYEVADERELVFVNGDIVQTRKWIWRQSELGKMTLESRNVFFQLVGFEDNKSTFMNAMDSLEDIITGRFGGLCQRFVVNQNNPEIEFTP